MKDLILVAMLACLIGLAWTSSSKADISADTDLMIFFSNDVRGETEPCG